MGSLHWVLTSCEVALAGMLIAGLTAGCVFTVCAFILFGWFH